MTQVSFRIDKNIKSDAEKVLNEIGLSMSVAITVFCEKWLENGVFHSSLMLILFIIKKIKLI